MDISGLDRIPIAKLNPGISANSAVHGVITLVWPFSSVNETISFLLVEPDFRLRRSQGQVRVSLRGRCARRVTRAGLLSGDEVTLVLEGAEWQKDRSTSTTPGRGIEWELLFTNDIRLQRKPEDGDTKFIDTSRMSSSPEPTPASNLRLPQATTAVLRPDVLTMTPGKGGNGNKESDTWASPIFLKSKRLPDIFPSKHDLDPFLEDDWETGPPSKKVRFGRKSDQWRYTERSPSPEKDEHAGRLETIVPSVQAPTFFTTATSQSAPTRSTKVDNHHEQNIGEGLSQNTSYEKLGGNPAAAISSNGVGKVAPEPTPSTSPAEAHSPKLQPEPIAQDSPGTKNITELETGAIDNVSISEGFPNQIDQSVFDTANMMSDPIENSEMHTPIFDSFVIESTEISEIPGAPDSVRIADVVIEEALATIEEGSDITQTQSFNMLRSSPDRLGASLARRRSLSRTPEPDLKISIMAATPLMQATTEDLRPLTPRLQPLASPGLSIVSPIDERRPQRASFFEAAFLKRTMPDLFVSGHGAADGGLDESHRLSIKPDATIEQIQTAEPESHQIVHIENQADTMFDRLLHQYDRGIIKDTQAIATVLSMDMGTLKEPTYQSKIDPSSATSLAENVDDLATNIMPGLVPYADETQKFPGLGTKQELQRAHRVDMLLDETSDSDQEMEQHMGENIGQVESESNESSEEEEDDGYDDPGPMSEEEDEDEDEEEEQDENEEDADDSSESEDSARFGKHRDMTYKPTHDFTIPRSDPIQSPLMTDHLESQHSDAGMPINEDQMLPQQGPAGDTRPHGVIQDTYFLHEEEPSLPSQIDNNEEAHMVEVVDLLDEDSSSSGSDLIEGNNVIALSPSEQSKINDQVEQRLDAENSDVVMRDVVPAESEATEQYEIKDAIIPKDSIKEQTTHKDFDGNVDKEEDSPEVIAVTRDQQDSPTDQQPIPTKQQDQRGVLEGGVPGADSAVDHEGEVEVMSPDKDSMQQEFYTVPSGPEPHDQVVDHIVEVPPTETETLSFALEDTAKDSVTVAKADSRKGHQSQSAVAPSEEQNEFSKRMTRSQNQQISGHNDVELAEAIEEPNPQVHATNSPNKANDADITRRSTRSRNQQILPESLVQVNKSDSTRSQQHNLSTSPRQTSLLHPTTRSQKQRLAGISEKESGHAAANKNEHKSPKRTSKPSKTAKEPPGRTQDSSSTKTIDEAQEPVKISTKSRQNSAETTTVPTQGFRTAHDFYATLPTIGDFHGNKISLIAVVVATTKPIRAVAGPRDYNQTLYLSSPHNPSNSDFTLAQIFRPFKSALPHPIPSGAAILLKDFKVQSYKRRMSLLSTDTSAWVCFDHNSASNQSEMQVTIAGPPVRFAAAERGVAWGLGKWWSKLESDNKDRIFKSATEAARAAEAELEKKSKAADQRQTPSRRRVRNADSQSFSQEGITTIPNTPTTPLTVEKPRGSASTSTRQTRQSQIHSNDQELSPTPTRSQPARRGNHRSTTPGEIEDGEEKHELRDGTTYSDNQAELSAISNRSLAPESAYARIYRNTKTDAQQMQQKSSPGRTRQGLRSADIESQNSQADKHELRDGKLYSDNDGATETKSVAADSQGRRSRRLRGKKNAEDGVLHELRDGAVYKD